MDIRNELNKIREDDYRIFSERIIKTSYPILGVRLPALRRLAKKIANEDGLSLLSDISFDSYEQLLLTGLVIGYSKDIISNKEKYIYDYLLRCDCWSLIDSFAMTFKPKKDEKENLWKILENWKHDQNLCQQYPYLERFVLVSELNTFLDDQHIDNVLDYSKKLADREYTVKMANAWMLATAFIRYPDKTLSVIDNLDKETIKYFKQKVRDSYRVSAEDKRRVSEYGCK